MVQSLSLPQLICVYSSTNNIHTHDRATQQSEGDGFSATTAAAQVYLERIGLRSVLEHGIVRLLETNPLPASTLSAWIVLATDITRVIKAQGHGQANDAVASAMLAGFESVVREEGQEQSRKDAAFSRFFSNALSSVFFLSFSNSPSPPLSLFPDCERRCLPPERRLVRNHQRPGRGEGRSERGCLFAQHRRGTERPFQQ